MAVPRATMVVRWRGLPERAMADGIAGASFLGMVEGKLRLRPIGLLWTVPVMAGFVAMVGLAVTAGLVVMALPGSGPAGTIRA